MGDVWFWVLLLWGTWTPLGGSLSVSSIGSPQECSKANFVPGHNLGGEGFDIVTMKRKGSYVIDTETWDLGNGTCRLYRNKYMQEESQKVPVAVKDWRTLPQCSLQVTASRYDSVEAFMTESTSAVSNDWKIGLTFGLAGVTLGGSHSRESTYAVQKSKEDRFSFFRHSVQCNFYKYGVKTSPPLSHDFKSAVNALPPSSSSTEHLYHDLINTFGTHYITQVSLGGKMKATTTVRTCSASMKDLTMTAISDCLLVDASVHFKPSVSVNAMFKHCEAERNKLGSGLSFAAAFNERQTEVIGGNIHGSDVLFGSQLSQADYNKWISSLQTLPDVVSYNLKPLHTLLPQGHTARAGLKMHVQRYIEKNAVMTKCSGSCAVGHRSNPQDPCACVCDSNQNIRSNCCPAGRGLATLKVFNLYAHDLYGDKWTQTDGSVQVKYGGQEKRTGIIPNDDNPHWSEEFEFGPIQLSMRNQLTFMVYDEDYYWNSDLLGTCSFDLHRGRVSDTCMFDYGTFFFSYEVQCAPSLSGDQCQEYVPSPMSSSLAKTFFSRNGVLVGK